MSEPAEDSFPRIPENRDVNPVPGVRGASAPSIGEWQPIETAPKSRQTEVLLWYPFSAPIAGVKGSCFIGLWGYPQEGFGTGGELHWVDPDSFEPLGGVTHWMPLPEPPK